MGGVARRAALIESIRKENPNVLPMLVIFLFKAHLYFNYYGGELNLN
jgi:5'-nucleotidase